MKIFLGFCFLAILSLTQSQLEPKEWWQKTVFYQIYPRSFKDSDGDGVGDINGITEMLPHLKEAGIGACWLSPVFKSPMVDFGYDISDFRNIDPTFGTMEDFERLFREAKALGIKIILDFVPNHTSDQHEWFLKSENRDVGYEDYYTWHDGKINPDEPFARPGPPNNWLQVFRGKAWEWSDKRQQYYYHEFATEQPDLNFRNPKVVQEMKDILTFWLEKGADGFRIDAIEHLMEVEDLRDEPRNFDVEDELNYDYLFHHYTQDLQETYDNVYEWRALLDDWQRVNGGDSKMLMTEAYANITYLMLYYQSRDGLRQGSHLPFNFFLVNKVDKDSSADYLKIKIDELLMNLPEGKILNWVLGNHDQPRMGSKFGVEAIGAWQTLLMTLPGAAVTYYGEEIGMLESRDISWEDSQDPQACNTDPENYKWKSRDPQRTPMQWDSRGDSTKNGGFSSADVTWLPVHPTYQTTTIKVS